MPEISEPLALAGMTLFLLGLVNGLLIPLGRSPRLLLSAHLTGVQSGTFLVATSVLWPHVHFPGNWSGPVGHLLWGSLYALWAALLLAGLIGAGKGLPIAGGGIETRPSYQAGVSALLTLSILGTLAATAAAVFWMIA